MERPNRALSRKPRFRKGKLDGFYHDFSTEVEMCGVGLNNLSLCYREREFQYVSVEVNDVMMCHDV